MTMDLTKPLAYRVRPKTLEEFVGQEEVLGKNKILVIHGKGTGVLKEEVRNRFIKDKRVKNLYISMENEGCTIIELNI